MPKKEYPIPPLLFLISFSYLILFCKYGFNIADEGVPLSGALRIMKGEVPLKDFQSYMPGVYYFYYAIFKIFGMDILTVRYVISFFTAIMVVMYYLASRKIMSVAFSLFGSFTILSVPGQYFMRYVTFFIIVNITIFYIYLDAKSDKKLSSAFYMGLAGGITLLFRQEFGLLVFFLSVVMLVINRYYGNDDNHGRKTFGEVRRYVLGYISIILPPIIYYLYEGKLLSILKVNYNAFFGDYHQNMSLPLPSLSSKWYELGLFYVPVLIYLFVSAAIIGNFKKNRCNREHLYILYILLIGILSFNYAILRTDPWHIVPVVLPAIMLYYYYYSCFLQKLNSIVKKIVFVIFLIIPISYIYTINNSYGCLIGSIDFSMDKYRLMDIQRAKIYTKPQDAYEYSELVSYIKNNTKPSDKILVVPYIGHPLYFLADRISPSYFEWVLPLEPMIYPDVEERIIEALSKDKTKLIIYIDFALDNLKERRFKNYAPRLYKWITDNYYLAEMVGDYQILRLGYNGSKNVFFDALDYSIKETPHSEFIKKTGMDVSGDRRITLFEHPPSAVKYKVRIPENSLLNFGIAIDPRVWDAKIGDGVNFEIIINEETTDKILFSRYINPKVSKDERKWIDESIDLSGYGGKEVILSLKTSAGPNGDNSYDWAGWSKLEFVKKD